MAQEDIFKKLVAHCKEYGYVFQSSEIYDGLAAVYDYGQYGVELKNNIKKYEKVLTLKNKYDNILFSFWLEKSNKNYNYISSKIDKNKKNKKIC